MPRATPIAETNDQLASLVAQLARLDKERAKIVATIEALRTTTTEVAPRVDAKRDQRNGGVDGRSPIDDKIALFRRLFRGRIDVFPVRWENARSRRSGYSPACRNEWRRGVCDKPKVKCSTCPNQAFLGVDRAVVEAHLRGARPDGRPFVMGVYPMLPDDSCWFLAADFDEEDWRRDAAAFAETCKLHGVPVAVERSRSGNGAHAWIFFTQAIPAALARRLGAFLITQTMERLPDIGFKSYDRFFPSQDTLPAGGFGNLIALPLQGVARSVGNSVFIDDSGVAFPDQWAFLSNVASLPRLRVEQLIEHASASGGLLSVRLPLVEDNEEPWLAPPSRKRAPTLLCDATPETVTLARADQLYVPRQGLPSPLVARLVRLAAFQNPEFYAAQAMRRSTHDKPRVISCAELTSHHIALPRGCFDAVMDLLSSLGVAVRVDDHRQSGQALSISFKGDLRPDQDRAVVALSAHDLGVLAATTAFGKTVVAIRMIAERRCNALILVHRRQLMDQWIERLAAFSSLPREAIGVIGGGKRKPGGLVDVAMIQSLFRNGEVDDIVDKYGHLVVDECHHISAVSFELAVRRAKARYVLGLSATVTRKDGHHPIIAMQCGPIRYSVSARSEAAKRPFDHVVRIRKTSFRHSGGPASEPLTIQELFRAVAIDEERNALIFDDVLHALDAGRSPVVLTERTDHLETLATRLSRFARHVVVLRGGMSEKRRRETAQLLARIPDSEERVIVATGRYLGEGFDDARLDTLFLTMPIAWKGVLAQYAGRLHRLRHAKREVTIYDYVDENVRALARMAAKRQSAYQALGYDVIAASESDLRGRLPMFERTAG